VRRAAFGLKLKLVFLARLVFRLDGDVGLDGLDDFFPVERNLKVSAQLQILVLGEHAVVPILQLLRVDLEDLLHYTWVPCSV